MSNPAPATEPFELPVCDIPRWVSDYPLVLLDTLAFAAKAHRFQRRKYTNEPYIYHPISVAERLVGYYRDQCGKQAPVEMIQAALLHDTVEDTDATFQEISDRFGFRVTGLVYWLTDLPMPGSNRETRKRLAADKLQFAPLEAQIIKHFDLIDNTESIEKYDEKFAKTYLREKDRMFQYSWLAMSRSQEVFIKRFQYEPAPELR